MALEIHVVNTNSWLSVANTSRDFSRGRILQRSGRQGLPATYALNYPVDQAILVNRLVQHQAGLVHASAVLLDGGAYLFAGPADVGKTTMARLWMECGATVLNDDRNIIRLINNIPTVSPSPWHGDLTEVNNRTLPLKAIFHLSQAQQNQRNSIDTITAVSKLIATSVAPFYLKQSMEKLLETWAQVCAIVPSYTLAFTPNTSIVDVATAANRKRAVERRSVIA